MRLQTPSFFAEKIVIERTALRYESWAYTRWHIFIDRAFEFIKSLLDFYTSSVHIRGLSLEYIDRFDALRDGANPDASEVINAESTLIAADVFRTQESWHSHGGWFDNYDNKTKRLVNINVDIGDVQINSTTVASARRTIQIRTSMTDFFNQPNFKTLGNDEVTVEFLTNRCQIIHADLKGLLRRILTVEAAERISLGEGS